MWFSYTAIRGMFQKVISLPKVLPWLLVLFKIKSKFFSLAFEVL